LSPPIRFAHVEIRPFERQVLLDGQPAQIGGRAFDLLLALIERRDRLVTKTELFEAVWPGVVVEENNLQVQVSALRKLLGAQAIATVAGRGYRFAMPLDEAATTARAADPADDWMTADVTRAVTHLFSDVESSTRLWEQHPAAMQGAMARHDALCREQVVRYGGRIIKMTGDGIHAVFLDSAAGVEAAVALQQALLGLQAQEPRIRVRVGLHRGIDVYRDGDFFGTAVNRAARVMSAAHGGQVVVSQAVVDAVGAQLPAPITLRELGAVRLRDLSAPERLYQVMHAALRPDFPPLRSLAATPNNLPQQLNSFVGREHELTEVEDLLAQQRLVSLLAMGGIGKSRLAVQAGAHLMDRFPDGVWLVELAPVADPEAVPQALAIVLGLREEPGSPVLDSLLRHLRDRKLLVLLDNCEHLIDACAQFARTLLQATTGIKILATSRDPLDIAGETVFSLAPLALPAPGEAQPQALMRHESVRLFVERARAAQPAFHLDSGNASAVAEICSRLDGIPLALELAAARVRVMTPQAIAGRLDQRFKLLVAGDRTALPRQKTLRALIDWSYDMLPAGEALLFARLAVFSAGWTVAAADQVCGFGALEQDDMLFLLASLVQKSLVLLDADTGRHRMLETVRAFAEEKLHATGDVQEVRRRHFVFFLALADEAGNKLFGPGQRRWLHQLDLESENILAAHAWCCDARYDVEQGLRLASSMRGYWIERGLLNVGIKIMLEALSRPGTESLVMPRIRATWSAADLMLRSGRYQEAWVYLTECLELVRPLQDDRRYATVLRSLSFAAAGLGDLTAARRYGEMSLEAARSLGQPQVHAAALNELGQVARAQRDLKVAGRLYRQALRLVRKEGDDLATAAVLLNLAMLLIGQARTRHAAITLAAAIRLLAELKSSPLECAAFDCAGALCVALGDRQRAAVMFATAEARLARSGQRRDPLDQHCLQPYLDAARSHPGAQSGEAPGHDASELKDLLPWLGQPMRAPRGESAVTAVL
jgi:predicted ATPase/class 3 adenylate cyclase